MHVTADQRDVPEERWTRSSRRWHSIPWQSTIQTGLSIVKA